MTNHRHVSDHIITSNSNDVEDEEEKRIISPKVFETSVTSKAHHIYLSEPLGEPVVYVDLIHRIKTAAQGDIVYIYLNTPGGRIDTGVQIINAMNASQAHIVTVLEGEVCSLGSLIFLSGDEFIVHDHCLFMIHNFSGGIFGKGHEQAAQLEGTTKWFNKLAKDVYIPFLTEEELERVIKGDDLWFDSGEVRSHLTKMIKQIQKEEKAIKRAVRLAEKAKKTVEKPIN